MSSIIIGVGVVCGGVSNVAIGGIIGGGIVIGVVSINNVIVGVKICGVVKVCIAVTTAIV